jgi:hypothetical protein
MFSSVFPTTFAVVFAVFLSSPAGAAETAPVVAVPAAAQPVLTVVLQSPGGEKPLKTWDEGTLKKLKSTSVQERDPDTGQVVSWKGVSFSTLIDQALEGLSISEKAQIDLVILKNGSGTQAFVPRSLISHYPVLLAWDRGGGLGSRGPWTSVVPWTSKTSILHENLPLERYWVPSLTTVELTNYRNLYSAYFLSRRTDPSAVRGEKIFVQNCLGCHQPAQVPQITTTDPANRVVATQGEHSTVKGAPKLGDRDWRALMSYFGEYKTESTPVVNSGGTSGSTGGTK